MKKRVLSFVIALIMFTSLLPVQAFAANAANTAFIILQNESGTAVPDATVTATVNGTACVVTQESSTSNRFVLTKTDTSNSTLYTITVDAAGYESQTVTMHGASGSLLVTLKAAVGAQWRQFKVCTSGSNVFFAEINVDISNVGASNPNAAWAHMDENSLATLNAMGLNSTTFQFASLTKDANGNYIATGSYIGTSCVLLDTAGKLVSTGSDEAEITGLCATHLGQTISWDGLTGTYFDGTNVYSVTLTQSGKTYTVGTPKVASGKYVVTYTDGVDGVTIFEDLAYVTTLDAKIPEFTGKLERAGYAFERWAMPNGEEPAGTVTGNMEIHAVWKILPQYTGTVEIKDANGTLTDLTAGAELYAKKQDTDVPVKMERKSTGVYSAALGNGIYNLYVKTGETEQQITGKIMWVGGANATCQLRYYSVSFSSEDGTTGVPEEAYALSGTSVIISETEPVREGYDFTGWKDEASGKTYQCGDAVTESCTLVAVWRKSGGEEVVDFDFQFQVIPDDIVLDEGCEIKSVEVKVLRTATIDGTMEQYDDLLTLELPCDEDEQVTGGITHSINVVSGYYYSVQIVSINGEALDGKGDYAASVILEGVDGYPGAFYGASQQQGTVIAAISLLEGRWNIVFDYGNNDVEPVTVKNKRVVPDLDDHMPADEDRTFIGWSAEVEIYVDGDTYRVPISVESGDKLYGDLYLTAQYAGDPESPGMPGNPETTNSYTVEGKVSVAATYTLDDGVHVINDVDRLPNVTVLLQKRVNQEYETIDFVESSLTYSGNLASVSYSFSGLPTDSEYRIAVSAANYVTKYQTYPHSDNYTDFESYTEKSYTAWLSSGSTTAKVNAYLVFVPDSFDLKYEVDASEISEAYRPQTVEVVVTYDPRIATITNPNNWNIISQMEINGTITGDEIELFEGEGESQYPVWAASSDGQSMYDYGVRVHKVDGNVVDETFLKGVHYEISYQEPAHKDSYTGEQNQMLIAYLKPKTYKIIYDLGGGVLSGNYDAVHVWSHESELGTPTRAGYQFMGWETTDIDGWDNAGTQTTIAASAYSKNLEGTITVRATWRRVVVNLQVLVDRKDDTSSSLALQTQLTSRNADGDNYQPVLSQSKTFANNIWSANPNDSITVVEIPYVYTDLEEISDYNVNVLLEGYFVISEFALGNETLTTGCTEVDMTGTNTIEKAYNVLVCLQYNQEMMYLAFSLSVAEGIAADRYPVSANVKVTYWNGETWLPIDEHKETAKEVLLDENGTASGTCPVRRWQAGDDTTSVPYYYRIEVVSLKLQNGTSIPLNERTPEEQKAAGYSAKVSVSAEGSNPSGATIPGAYSSNEESPQQLGTLNAEICMGRVVFHTNNDAWTVRDDGIFRTYYPAAEVDEANTDDGVYYLPTTGVIEAFYDIPDFEYRVHNEYIFKGWYTEETGGEAIEWPYNASGSEQVDLYAQWFEVGTVAKEDDGKNVNRSEYSGFDLMGVQIRYAELDGIPHYGNPSPGLRFITSFSNSLHDELRNDVASEDSVENVSEEETGDGSVVEGETASSGDFEYGFVIASADAMIAAAESAGESGFEILYNGTSVNGEDTTDTHGFVQNGKCNGVPDHYPVDVTANPDAKYRLYTIVVTYKDLEGEALKDAYAKNFVVRSYVKYKDRNGLVRIYYNNYTGDDRAYNGISISYATASHVIQ